MARAGDGKQRSSKRQTSRQLYKRLTEAEFEAFIERAAKAGFDDHRDYLTAFALSGAGLEQGVRKAMISELGQLGKVGSNINQIAKAVNEGRVESLSADDLRIIEDARKAVEDASIKIRGVLQSDR